MRSIVSEQNPLRYPLNKLFGTEANIRLLRVLATEDDRPLTAADAAKRAGLTTVGARKALRRLLQSGFVIRIGGAPKDQYSLRRADRLVQAALKLFQEEKDRYEALLRAIKTRIRDLAPPPHSAWIQALPVAPGHPFVLGVLHDARNLTNSVRQLRAQLEQVEGDFDLTIEVSGHTKVDRGAFEVGEFICLHGTPPFPDKMEISPWIFRAP